MQKAVILFTISLLLLVISTFGQTCIHDDLSHTFRITVIKRKFIDSIIKHQCPIKVRITDKANRKNTQVISFTAPELYSESFTKCHRVRSYTTGKNRNASVLDNDFGDIVVADFNFDGKDDIAIKSDDAFSGTYYRFYIQDKDKLFKLDSFLTDSMSVIPTHFNPAKKTLTSYERAGVREGEQIYRLDLSTNKWHLIRHRFIPPL